MSNKSLSVIFKNSLIFKLPSDFDEPEIVELGFNAKIYSFAPTGHVYIYLAFHNNTDDANWFPCMEVTFYVDVQVKFRICQINSLFC